MTKTREKKLVVTGVTREVAELSFADYAIADAMQQRITSKMDVEITRIREKYQDDLAKLQERKDKSFEAMQTFAIENRDELFSKKKSVEFTHGVIGFRTGTPKLKTLKGFTWGAVTNLLSEFLPAYVRMTKEPAKDLLLCARDMPDISEMFPKVGIFVDQDETFYVEPKKEEFAVNI
ncbi:MAG: host-nuclease inhibitor Gam family protein [Bacteroidetes bacterium]|nr:host-nuclease inhibitor Gam family protein [Bacteroidota bacterium]